MKTLIKLSCLLLAVLMIVFACETQKQPKDLTSLGELFPTDIDTIPFIGFGPDSAHEAWQRQGPQSLRVVPGNSWIRWVKGDSITANGFWALSQNAGNGIESVVTDTAVREWVSSWVGDSISNLVIAVDSLGEIPLIPAPLGSRIVNRTTGATYVVQADTVTGYTTDSIAAIPTGGNHAILQSNSGTYSISDFGAIADDTGDGTGTDQTALIQKAIDFAHALGGGRITVPPSLNYYKISKIYLPSNMMITGVSQGEELQSITRRGSKFLVTGQGIIIGYDSYALTKTPTNIGVENLTIAGTATAKSGIRIGSDVSFKSVGRFHVRDCFIFGFTSSSASQIIYDKSTIALGSDDANYPGTRAVTGACGIFIAGGITGMFERVDLKGNYYSLYESAGTFCTTINFSNCTFRQSLAQSVTITTAKGMSFTNNTVFEGSVKEALLVLSETSGLASLQAGPSSILLDNCWFEGNNVSNPNGFTIRAENQNSGQYIEQLNVINTKLASGSPGQHLIMINRGRSCFLNQNNYNLNAVDTQLLTINTESVIFDGEIKAVMVTDNQTVVKRRIQNGVFDVSGGINSDMRGSATGANTTETVILGGGSDITLLANTVYHAGDMVTYRFWGTFGNNANAKTLRLKIDGSTIKTNTINTAPASSYYVELILMVNVLPSNYKYIVRMQTDDTMETIAYGSGSTTNFWTTNRAITLTGQNGVATASDIVGQGWNATFIGFNKR